ncbi:hypothetical protein BaRGS_00027207, partial [Batillaria attramentaria]
RHSLNPARAPAMRKWREKENKHGGWPRNLYANVARPVCGHNFKSGVTVFVVASSKRRHVWHVGLVQRMRAASARDQTDRGRAGWEGNRETTIWREPVPGRPNASI